MQPKYDRILFYNPTNNYTLTEGKNNTIQLASLKTDRAFSENFESVDLYKNLAIVKLKGKMSIFKNDKLLFKNGYDSIMYTNGYTQSNKQAGRPAITSIMPTSQCSI